MTLSSREASQIGLELNQDGQRRTAFELLSYPHVGYDQLVAAWPELHAFSQAVKDRVTSDAVYAVYLDRQMADIASYERDAALRLPDEMDVAGISGLSGELKTKLSALKPADLAQAGRIEGMTPAALTLLAAHARRFRAASAA